MLPKRHGQFVFRHSGWLAGWLAGRLVGKLVGRLLTKYVLQMRIDLSIEIMGGDWAVNVSRKSGSLRILLACFFF